MKPELQTRIQRYGWDKAADSYEQGWKHSLADAQHELLIQAEVWPGENVIDLACGTGLVTLPLALTIGPTGRVLATDLSEKMVDVVRLRAESQGLSQITTLRADAGDLSMVQDASVDLVTCALGLMYVPDTLAVISEALRVLRPGGRAVFAVWGARRKCGWADIFPIVDARVKSEVCPMFFRLGTGETLSCEMDDAGFYGISTSRIRTNLAYRDQESAIDAAFSGGPVALAYHRFDAITRASVHSEYLDSIEPFWTDEGYLIPGEFVVCRGFKPA